MNKHLKRLLIITFMALLLVGCGMPDGKEEQISSEGQDLVLMIGNNYGSTLVDYSYFEQDIKETLATGGRVMMFQMDSSPTLLSCVEVDQSELKGKSPANKNKTYDLYTQACVIAANESLPTDAGVDIVAAFLEVSKNISRDEDVNIICCSNMISTNDALVDMSLGVDKLTSYMDTTLEKLKEQSNLPDLKNVRSITCYGAGIITSQEDNLTNREVNELEVFFKELFAMSGCTNVSFKTETLPQNTELLIPEECKIYPEIPVFHESIKIGNEGYSMNQNTVERFDGENIQFVGDSDCFVDETKTREKLEPLVKVINCEIDKGNSVALVGSTATLHPNKDGDRELSLARAEAVKQLLVQLGVKDSKSLNTYGVGYHPAFCKNNFNSDGSFNEEYAQYNRAVSIMLSSNTLVDIAKNI